MEHSNAQIVEAYTNADFNKSKTARDLGIKYSALLYLIKNDPDLKSMMHEALETRVDLAEKGLQELIAENNFPAIKFFLENKGRDRGYGNRIEVQSADESAAIMAALNRKHSDSL